MASCCKYHAGQLREIVQFQRIAKTSDGAGGFTEAWASLSGAPTRAMVKALSGSERFASARVEATAKLRVVTRYFAGLRETDAVMIRGKRHNIRFINNVDFDDKWLEIDVDGGVAPE